MRASTVPIVLVVALLQSGCRSPEQRYPKVLREPVRIEPGATASGQAVMPLAGLYFIELVVERRPLITQPDVPAALEVCVAGAGQVGCEVLALRAGDVFSDSNSPAGGWILKWLRLDSRDRDATLSVSVRVLEAPDNFAEAFGQAWIVVEKASDW